ncbi:Lcl C-terminal domain-containing protein [Aeromonas sp. OTU364]|uniref:Lcl C-terminal domain-containing protein n=1 Tax=Aeromonas sp. OTU364 TaxID=3043864 RepID=UPI00313D798D
MTPLACLLAPLLSACGGGGSDEAPLTAPDYRLTVNLPAAGTLCVNLNQNDNCEPGEPVVSGEAGARQLSASAPGLLTSPLLFLPRDPDALTLTLTHPAARLDDQHLTPTPLSTLLQTRVADGIPPAQALAELLLALAPLQPDQGLAALVQLEEFNRALEALALATRDDAASLPGLATGERQRQIWQGLVTLLPELARHFAASPELLSQQARLAAVLMQQQPRALVTASGVTTYTDGVDYLLTQEPADHPGQEASLGQAPLRYRKLDGKGQPLADNADEWECVEDLNTGLIWEKKLDDPDSPRDLHKVFAWEFGNYHPSQAELDYACPEGEAICSTEQYRQWLNGQRLCGIGHWRLPTAQELGSLQHYGSLARQDGQRVSLDVRYFPDVGPSSGDFDGSYWTQTLTPSRRLESVPIAVISPLFLGEDAGTDYPYGVQNENEINAIQLRLVAEVTR